MSPSDLSDSHSFANAVADCICLAEKRFKPAFQIEVLITSFGLPFVTLECIRSLLIAKSRIGLKIIVAEDASGDTRVERLSSIPGVIVHRNISNLGYVKNCNANIDRYIKGDFFVLLNNDTVVHDFWIDHLLDTILKGSNIGAVGAKLLNIDGTLQEAGGIIWSDGSAWNWGSGMDPNRYDFNFVRETDYCSAACLLVRTEAWNSVGGFSDEYAPAYYEDSDLAFKFRKIGYATIFQPSAVVTHLEGLSHGKNLMHGVKALQVRNKHTFLSKWHDLLVRQHYEAGSNLPLAIDRRKRSNWVLVVEQTIPTPARDAGSRVIDQLIRCLVSLGFRLTLWTIDCVGADEITQGYQQIGVEVVLQESDESKKTLDQFMVGRAGLIDAIFVSRPMTYFLFDKFRANFKEIPVVFYGHDLHWKRQKEGLLGEYVSRDVRVANSSWREALSVESHAWLSADVSVYSSSSEVDFIENWLGQYPTLGRRRVCLAQPFWLDVTASEYTEDRTGVVFVAGWDHPPNVEGALWFVNEVLPIVREKIPELKITLAGSNPPFEIKRLESETISVQADLSETQLLDIYRQASVAVVPLRSGAGVKHKTLEALAHGVPLLSTKIGLQGLCQRTSKGTLHRPCSPCIEANTPRDFSRNLITILEDFELRSILSAAGKKYIETYYSEVAFSKSWGRIFEQVTSRVNTLPK